MSRLYKYNGSAIKNVVNKDVDGVYYLLDEDEGARYMSASLFAMMVKSEIVY